MAHTKGVVSRGLHKDKLIQTNADNPLLTVTICGVFGNDETANADANLIVDAFNVTNETDLTPRELLSQRDELVDALKLLYDSCNPQDVTKNKRFGGLNLGETYVGGVSHPSDEAIHKANDLLTKINTKP